LQQRLTPKAATMGYRIQLLSFLIIVVFGLSSLSVVFLIYSPGSRSYYDLSISPKEEASTIPRQMPIIMKRTSNQTSSSLKEGEINGAENTANNESKVVVANESKVMKYWRFDEAAPPIQKATTHYLSSIPSEHRLPRLAMENLTEYASQKVNVWPNKLHLFEYNPCITQLPKKYQDLFSQAAGTPVYLVSYRINHINNCFRSETYLKLYGGSWKIHNSIPQTDHLGLALLREDMTVLADTVVTMKNDELKSFRNYQDYRIFTLHGELFLTTGITIVPLYLSEGGSENRPPGQSRNKGLVRLEFVFSKSSSFGVWIRRYASCPVYGWKDKKQKGTYYGSKNLLYFVDGNNASMVEYFPNKNPLDIRKVDIHERCGTTRIKDYDHSKVEAFPDPSFRTIDEFMYPLSKRKARIFMGDRGSACCVNIEDPDGRNLFLGVAHPKTTYPGKRLPAGVTPNIYLSRFFAFEQYPPYHIVARSGMFCFGYTQEREESGNHPLWNSSSHPLIFATESFECPRIHFVMGIVDKVGDDSKVIISYGVSDCLSRFAEVDKADIVKMLWIPS
jgi:hypothetical protein